MYLLKRNFRFGWFRKLLNPSLASLLLVSLLACWFNLSYFGHCLQGFPDTFHPFPCLSSIGFFGWESIGGGLWIFYLYLFIISTNKKLTGIDRMMIKRLHVGVIGIFIVLLLFSSLSNF